MRPPATAHVPEDNGDDALSLADAAAIIRGPGRPVLQKVWPMMVIWGSVCVVGGVGFVLCGTGSVARVIASVLLLAGTAVTAAVMLRTCRGIVSSQVRVTRGVLAAGATALGVIGLATAFVSAPTVAGVPTVCVSAGAGLSVGAVWVVSYVIRTREPVSAIVGGCWIVILIAYFVVGLPIAAYLLAAGGLATVIAAIPARAVEIRRLVATGSLRHVPRVRAVSLADGVPTRVAATAPTAA